MSTSDEDRCPVAPPPHSCLRTGPIRSWRVTFSQDSEPRVEEEDPGRDLDDVTHHSQEVGVSDLPGDGQGHTWSVSLQSDRKCGRGVGVLELSVVLGGLLQLVDRYWSGPGSLQRHQQFLGGAYDLLSELLPPAGRQVRPDQGRVRPNQERVRPDQERVRPDQGRVRSDQERVRPDQERVRPDQERVRPDQGRVRPDQGRVRPDQERVSFSELVLLRRKLERNELQLEAMKSRLLMTLKENYELRRRRHFN